MTEYIHRYFIFVRWDKIELANRQADKSQGGYDPDTGGNKTFGSVRLSADGQEPATHTACNTAATDAMRTGIFNSGNPPFITIYDMANGWTWETALENAGLQIIQGDL